MRKSFTHKELKSEGRDEISCPLVFIKNGIVNGTQLLQNVCLKLLKFTLHFYIIKAYN